MSDKNDCPQCGQDLRLPPLPMKEYNKLEAERDRLKDKLEHGAVANHQAWNRIREQDKEIDRLKAEVENRTSLGYQRLKTDRDTWKTRAEKMAEALREIIKVSNPELLASRYTMEVIAKAVLEKMGK